jgi:hypothetical protein
VRRERFTEALNNTTYRDRDLPYTEENRIDR